MAVDTATAAHTCATAVIATTTYALIIAVETILVGSSSMILADVIVFGIVDVTAVGAVRVMLFSTGQGDKGRLGRRSRITGRHGIISRDRL